MSTSILNMLFTLFSVVVLLFIVNIEPILCYRYQYSLTEWRMITLSTLPDYTSKFGLNFMECNSTCANDASCFSYSVSVGSGVQYLADGSLNIITCRLHDTRFGLGTTLDVGNGLDYYEKPIGFLAHDDVGAILTQYKTGTDATQWTTTFQTYLSRYRNGVDGYASISNDEGSIYDVIAAVDSVPSAEQCAAYCTRDRGVMDEVGNRCISFNYEATTARCHLLSFSVDSYHTLAPSNGNFKYYERIIGDGCWISNPDCRRLENSAEYDNWVGHFVDYTIEYEYLCIEQARYVHEDICDSYADYATQSMWGTDGRGVVETWNTWDLTTGCVIELGSVGCPNSPLGDTSRFRGTFRDTIGEYEFAAADSTDLCFARAQTWYDYCGFAIAANQSISLGGDDVVLIVRYPDTGEYYKFPVEECVCDGYGRKIDYASRLQYCTLEFPASGSCYRQDQHDYWSNYDILCADLLNGCAVIADAGDTVSQCYIYVPRHTQTTKADCEDNAIGCGFSCNEKKNVALEWEYSPSDTTAYTLYSQIPCAEFVDEFGITCAEVNVLHCQAIAERIHKQCDNSLSQEDEQVYTYYAPTGGLGVFPEFEDPFSAGLIRGVSTDALYTADPEQQIIDLMPIRNGRWMTFTPVRSKVMRQLSIWFVPESEITQLTLKLFLGHGITVSEEIYETSQLRPANGIEGFIHFVFPAVPQLLLQSGETYTWQISSNNIASQGFVGYVRGNGYSGGIGDMAWDYLFVVWIEYLDTSLAPLQALVVIPGTTRPWFELWFAMGLGLLVLFCCFLCLLAWKRRHDEKKEREEDRRFQAELKRRAQLAAEEERKRADEEAEWEKRSITDMDHETANDVEEVEMNDDGKEVMLDEDGFDMNAADTDDEEDYEDEEEEDAAEANDDLLDVDTKQKSKAGMAMGSESELLSPDNGGHKHALIASSSIDLDHEELPNEDENNNRNNNDNNNYEQKKKKKKRKKKKKSRKN